MNDKTVIRMLTAYSYGDMKSNSNNFSKEICKGNLPEITFGKGQAGSKFNPTLLKVSTSRTTTMDKVSPMEAAKVLLTLVGSPLDTLKSGAKPEEVVALLDNRCKEELFLAISDRSKNGGPACDNGVALMNYIKANGNPHILEGNTQEVSEEALGTPHSSNLGTPTQMTEQTQVSGNITYLAFAYSGNNGRIDKVFEVENDNIGSFVTQITSRAIEACGGHKFSQRYGRSWETTTRNEEGHAVTDKNMKVTKKDIIRNIRTQVMVLLKGEGAYVKNDRNAIAPLLTDAMSQETVQAIRNLLTSNGFFVRSEQKVEVTTNQYPNLQL